MATIKDFMTALYNRGVSDGYAKAQAELQAVINEIVGSGTRSGPREADAPDAQTETPAGPPSNGAGQVASSAPQPTRRRRRTLTRRQQEMLTLITNNPGISARDLKELGVKSLGPAYELLHRRKVRVEHAPKPYSSTEPRTFFFPVEPTK